ncbi:hypothetical protein WBP07_17895 [Novosphingobium sp. BL-8A]|uniref:hypothetical protein n=1 Tax=Novosphingobium sp. BL-8A TaxID=3127639 RepID=UPI0037578548
MLQIIGWLGCLYLIVKCLEIASNSDFRNANGDLKGMPLAACVIGWFGAVIFAVALYLVGASIPNPMAPAGSVGVSGPVAETPEETMSPAKMECISKAKTTDEILACK